jgi:hypothetical protein
MDVINLGATEGLAPVNWANVVEKLDAGSPLAPTLTTLARRGSRR